MTGTFDAVGTSLALVLQPKETLTLVFSVASSAVFNGTVAVEVSRDDGASWQVGVATDGTSLVYAGEQAADFAVSKTIRNETAKAEAYRVRVTVFDVASDDLTYDLSTVVDDVVADLFRDHRGRVVLQSLDNGGLRVPGRLFPNSLVLASGIEEFVLTGVISAADIIATGAGKFGHAEGVPLVPAVSGYRLEFVSLVAYFDRLTAAYTDGGNITVNATGGAALTGLVSAANSLGSAAAAIYLFVPLAAAALAMPSGLSLVSSAAFTNPGTAAGVIRWKLRYRLITLQ